MLILLIVLIIIFLLGGWQLGPGPGYYGGFGIGGLLLIILIVLLVMGRL